MVARSRRCSSATRWSPRGLPAMAGSPQQPRKGRARSGALRATADASKLVATVEDGRSVVWSLDTGERIGALDRHNGEVEDGYFSPDGAFIATAGTEGAVKIWDVASLREVATFPANLGNIYQV